MKEGFQVFLHETMIWMVAHGLRIVLILTGALIVKVLSNRFMSRLVRLSVKPDETRTIQDEKQREDTLIRIFLLAINYAIFAIVVMMVLQEMGVSIGPILAGAGIFGLAFGFGSQYLIRDIISGFFVIMENQYRIGDVVRFDTVTGKVVDINLRIATLRDMDGTIHHVPHGEIKRVANYSKSFARVNLNIPIVYGSNLDLVIKTINKVGLELSADPEWKNVVGEPIHFLRVEDFSESAIVIKIVGETRSIHQWHITGELRKRIKEAFEKEGIEMPDKNVRLPDLPAKTT